MKTPAGSASPYQAFDALSLGFGVVREGTLVHANAALLRLVGRPASEVVGQAGTAHIAGPFAESMRERHEARLRGDCVPDTYETVLRTPEGERRVEVSVSVEGPDTVFLVRDVTARARHRAVLQRLAELGAALPSARTEEEVLQRVFSGLAELGLTFAWLVPQGERLRVERRHIAPELAADAEVLAAFTSEGGTGSRTPPLMRAWSEGVALEEDFAREISRFVEAERAEPVREAIRRAGELHVIAVRIDVEGAPRALLAFIASWLREEELAPLRLFGAQVSAALEAARTISRLSAQNTALSALNRLASVATTAAEPSALFEPGAREITQLLGCDAAALFLRAEARNEVELVYGLGMDEATRATFARLSAGEGISGRDLQEGVPVVLDVASCPPYSRESLRAMGYTTLVVTPLRVRSRVVGSIAVAFRRPRELSALERETLQAMGSHFAAATESHRLLEDLQKSYAQLARAHEQLVQRERLAALGQLSAVVAHEVRNPLGAIFNSVATLRRVMGEQGPAVTLLDILGEEAERLNRIVDDLLNFARPASPSPQPVGLERLLEEAVRRALAAATGTVEVEWTLEPHVPPVPVDERMMSRAFLNLALNAVQAMPHGGVLRVGVRRAPGERPGVEVEFTDTGLGITPETLARIFEPFFTTKATGTGLGLALVKSTIESHAGRISVDSPPGRGTTFRLFLPSEPEPTVPLPLTGG